MSDLKDQPPHWLDEMFRLIDAINDHYSWHGGYRNPYPLPSVVALEELSYIEDSLIVTYPFITPVNRDIILRNLRYLSLEQARSYRVTQRSTSALHKIHAVLDRIFTQHPTLLNQEPDHESESRHSPDTKPNHEPPEGQRP